MQDNPTIRKAGRPTKYKVEFNEQARKLCLLGATDKALADFFEVDEASVNLWKKKHPKFYESIKKGKELADAKVAEKLYQRAIGYTTTETRLATFNGKFTDEKEVNIEYPPDKLAMIFWLKNRQPRLWRDKHHIEHEGVIDSITDEKINDRITELLGSRA